MLCYLLSVRIIIKRHIATEVEGVFRAAGKVTGFGGLELYQWRPHLGYGGA
jgi:hypothetical protein